MLLISLACMQPHLVIWQQQFSLATRSYDSVFMWLLLPTYAIANDPLVGLRYIYAALWKHRKLDGLPSITTFQYPIARFL